MLKCITHRFGKQFTSVYPVPGVQLGKRSEMAKGGIVAAERTQGGLSPVVFFILRPLSRQQASSMSLKGKTEEIKFTLCLSIWSH